MRVIVVGSITLDHQVLPDGAEVRQVGGTALYGAAAWAAAGHDVVSVTRLGGPWAEAIRRVAARLGVALAEAPASEVTTFRNRLGPDGARTQELITTAPPLGLDAVAAPLARADLVHLGPLHGADLAPEVFAAVRRSGARAGLDGQGLVRSSAIGPVRPLLSAELEPAFAAVGSIKLGEDEAQAVERGLGLAIPDLAGRLGGVEILVTRGERGGERHANGEPRLAYDAVPVAREVDPTGAGDVFFASYLAARSDPDASVAAALGHAAAVAARKVSGTFLAREALTIG